MIFNLGYHRLKIDKVRIGKRLKKRPPPPGQKYYKYKYVKNPLDSLPCIPHVSRAIKHGADI